MVRRCVGCLFSFVGGIHSRACNRCADRANTSSDPWFDRFPWLERVCARLLEMERAGDQDARAERRWFASRWSNAAPMNRVPPEAVKF